MLSFYQRLIVGRTLLLAIVFGLALLCAPFVHRAAAKAALVDNSARAAAGRCPRWSRCSVANSRPFMHSAGTELRSGRASWTHSSTQMQDAQQQFLAASFSLANSDPTISLKPVQQMHNALAAMVTRAPLPRRLRANVRLWPRQNFSLHLRGWTKTSSNFPDPRAGSTTQPLQMPRATEQLGCTRHYVFGSAFLAALLVAAVTAVSVILPLRHTARSAQRIGQGDLQARVEWRSRDDLGIVATELNRMAVRLRDLRETESGRRQMEHQLSDAVLHSIFEPVIVTDAKGHVLKLNQASIELLGEAAAADRMALTNTPGGLKILDAVRDAVSMQRPVAQEGEAALLPMRIGKAQRSYRLRATPMRDAEGKLLGAVTVLEDVTEMQEVDRFKSRFIAIASKKLREPLKTLRLGLYTLSRGFGGELRPLQADLIQGRRRGRAAQRLDVRPHRGRRTRYRRSRRKA